MNKKNFKMSFDDHNELGTAIYQLRNKLMNLNVGPVVSKATKKLEKLKEAIDEFRCEMDNVVCKDYPQNEFATKCYYKK